jgi:hypothetical protein
MKKQRSKVPAASVSKNRLYENAAQRLQQVHSHVAGRLNRYTARWPPTTWKIVLALYCLLMAAYWCRVALHSWH